MIGWILGLIYSIFMGALIGYLGGSVIEGVSSTILYLIFMTTFVGLFISTTHMRIMNPTKKYTFFKYF